MRKLFLYFFGVFFTLSALQARPQFSMLTGNRCLNCHVNVQGGGIRSPLGAYSRSGVSIFEMPGGMKDFFETVQNYNSFDGGKIIVGLDARSQTAKLPAGRGLETEREFFGMQSTPYLALRPFQWLTASGYYNFTEALYQGQESWGAQIILQPDYEWPSLRFGYVRPSIGNVFDDHTVYVRQFANSRSLRPYLPPDMNDWGAEISYDWFKWLSLTAGAYKTETLANIVVAGPGPVFTLSENKENMGYLARIAFLPRFFDKFLNTNIGGSYYTTDDFDIINLFFHAGLTDIISFIVEFNRLEKANLWAQDNFMAEILYQITPALMASVRAERANSTFELDGGIEDEYNYNGFVFGLNIYPIPFIEIRPEYRIRNSEHFDKYSAQWAAQFHLYY